ncbi:CRISPR system precrRNA processing endoribonuclease RAMP protein Cas6, partial [uncultured Phascolarctobacterium sp.]|uniref:CRISPR system precrRNA processing endoribonuclease RAMP protein Cas6 n=1 Tax=uncultured Phascolarctobacterium sp. TaxID=512296 RepID=UPI0027D9CDB8
SDLFLLGSLIKRWNSFADKERLDALGLAQDLAQETYVADYKLSLRSFSVDGAHIPAFRGLYVLGMKNNVMCNRIIAMLGEYANYSGIGIKTALGMGAVKTSLNERF